MITIFTNQVKRHLLNFDTNMQIILVLMMEFQNKMPDKLVHL